MKNTTITSFLRHFHLFNIVVIAALMIMLLQTGSLLAQSKEQLPTVKISKKRKEPREVNELKKPKKTKDTYRGPKTSSHPGKAKDNYKRPESLRKAEKSRDRYQQPASKTVNYNNSPQQNQNNPPPFEEGQPNSRLSWWKRVFRKNTVSTFEGNQKRTKQKEGTNGTVFQGTIKQHKIDYDQLANDQHLYQGKIRRAPQKRVDRQFQYKAEYMNFYSGGKRILKPEREAKYQQKKADYMQTAGLYKVKKQKDKAASYTSYHGQIKLPTLKAKTRHSKKLSEKVHQYDGDIRYRKPGKDMHPSVFHLKAKTKNSYEQKEKYRRWRLVLSHIFKTSDQPKHLKEKDHKPRYDKDESEIWYY